MACAQCIIALLLLPVAAAAADKQLDPLPCGIYDEAVKPLVEKDLQTRDADSTRHSIGITTKSGKKLSVEIKNVPILMPGERNQVSVFLDGKPFAKTSHQDVPLYLEVHIDGERYRIICVRIEEQEMSPDAGKQGKEERKTETRPYP